MLASILIVDDDDRFGRSFGRALTDDGHRVDVFDRARNALRELERQSYDLLFTDLVMPEIDGLDFLDRARRTQPDCAVVVMTGFGSVDTARAALKNGALDYITKPVEIERDVRPLIEQVLARPRTAGAGGAPRLEDAFAGYAAPEGRLGPVLHSLPRIAAAPSPVLVLGESGTGKELVASAIHRLSSRRARPYIRVSGAALAEGLLDAELFGAVRGAYTGAHRDRPGLLERAHGGTLFLDEIGEISRSLQSKLLRVLQDGTYQRVGESGRTRRADVRFVAATNRDLERAVRAGSFRPDLFYRLHVLPVRLPPLRERMEEIPELVRFTAERLGHPDVRIAPDALEVLRAHSWPGNLRELRNAVEHAVVLGDGRTIERGDLPEALRSAPPSRVERHASTLSRPEGVERLCDAEVRNILRALRAAGWNRTRAARLLGITRRTLHYRIQKHDLEPEIARLRAEGRRERTPALPGILGPPGPGDPSAGG